MDRQIAGVDFSSAGTRAVIGHPMHPQAADVLESLEGDPGDFIARQFTPRIAVASDLLLTMTRAHRDRVLEIAPQKLNRTLTLSEAACATRHYGAQGVADLAVLRPHLATHPDATDVRDPIGQSREFFASIGAEIADLLPWVLDLCLRSSKSAGS